MQLHMGHVAFCFSSKLLPAANPISFIFQCSCTPPPCCRCVSTGQLRHFAAHGEPPKVVPNPLQQIVPPILKGVGAAVGGLKSGSAALWEGLTSGPATQATIAYFADNVSDIAASSLLFRIR